MQDDNSFVQAVNQLNDDLFRKFLAEMTKEEIALLLQRQAMIEGFYKLLILFVIVLLTIAFLAVLPKLIAICKRNKNAQELREYSFIAFAVCMAMVLVWIKGFHLIYDIMTAFFNPDYYVVNQIADSANMVETSSAESAN